MPERTRSRLPAPLGRDVLPTPGTDAVVAGGGLLYLIRHGGEPVAYPVFRGEPHALRSIPGILTSVTGLGARGIIQIGLLLLIATPVARVAFSAVAFLLERDRMYVVVTLIVLVTLLYSLAAA